MKPPAEPLRPMSAATASVGLLLVCGEPRTAAPGRPVLRVTLNQRLGVDRAKHGTLGLVDDGHHDLRAARRVEHKPVDAGTWAGDADQVAYRELPSTSRAYPRLSTISVACDH